MNYEGISNSTEFEQRRKIIEELNPKRIRIEAACGLRDLSVLQNLPRLEAVELADCMDLQNLDALRIAASLKLITISGCPSISRESIATLKAARPDMNILNNVSIW